VQEQAARYASESALKADIAASFQAAVVDTLAQKCKRAMEQTGICSLVIAGGVGANQALRAKLSAVMQTLGGVVYYPRPEFCTDNGVMVAYLGFLRLQQGGSEALAVRVHPRWLMEESALVGMR
jgi:N6-L-threonylcarbamoyladenine synthase